MRPRQYEYRSCQTCVVGIVKLFDAMAGGKWDDALIGRNFIR
jgi:hypothetical protein